MRAVGILQTQLGEAMGFMHKARWEALCRAVESVLTGGRLWLTAIGRSLPSESKRKHAIKAVDRLLANELLYAERNAVYAVLAEWFVRKRSRPLVLVDTTQIREGVFALVASLAYDGRSIPIYWMIVDRQKPSISVGRRFLDRLSEVLPLACRPILVMDAGFESPWFDEITARSWDYVARARNRTTFLVAGRWVVNTELHRHAGRRAKNLGMVLFPRTHNTRPRRLVLSKEPTTGHRWRKTKKGTRGQRKDDYKYQRGANEPWLLATSLTCNAAAVVSVFATRMQIEQNFRDTKNHRWGWSLADTGTRSQPRLEILLLIASLAYCARVICGRASETMQLHHQHQANTERKRRVLSLFVLGGLVLDSPERRLLTRDVLLNALREIRFDVAGQAFAS